MWTRKRSVGKVRIQAVRASPAAGAGQFSGAGEAALSAGAEEYAINNPPPAGPRPQMMALED
eukprot:2138662-Karenia_brevis.AAC.1